MKVHKNAQRGFTLMELMVVIVIVAILAAVAVPLYINYVKDARLTEAKGAIGAIMTAEQAYAQKNPVAAGTNPYFAATFNTTSPSVNNCDLSDVVNNNWVFDVTQDGTDGFQVAVSGQDTLTFTYHKTGGSVFSR